MTEVRWFARLVNAEGAAAANVGVQLQVFDMKDGWKGIADATTDADGRVKASADAPGGPSGPAPMLRLMETDAAPAVLGGVPTVSVSGSTLACDFGEIVHIPDRFTIGRATAMRAGLRPAAIAGIVNPVAAAKPAVATAIRGTDSDAEVGELRNRLLTRDTAFSQLQVERDAVASQLTTRANEAKQAQTERDEARTLLNARLADVQKLQADNATARAELETRTAAIKAVQGERDDAKTQLAQRVLDVQRLQGENATVVKQASINANALKAALAERDDVRNQLATREIDVEKLRLERDQVKAQLAESEKRLAANRAGATASAAASPDAATGGLGAFATRLGGEIDSAQVALRNRGFSLGIVKVRTPVLVDKAQILTLPDKDEIKALPPGALSEVSLDYHPTPETDAAGTGVAVPDIRQLTESAARRVLVSVGLGLEVTQGPPSLDPSCAEGQVMLQTPRAGDQTPRGTRVIAVFSRKEG